MTGQGLAGGGKTPLSKKPPKGDGPVQTMTFHTFPQVISYFFHISLTGA
jgi:hypothetical protein